MSQRGVALALLAGFLLTMASDCEPEPVCVDTRTHKIVSDDRCGPGHSSRYRWEERE